MTWFSKIWNRSKSSENWKNASQQLKRKNHLQISQLEIESKMITVHLIVMRYYTIKCQKMQVQFIGLLNNIYTKWDEKEKPGEFWLHSLDGSSIMWTGQNGRGWIVQQSVSESRKRRIFEESGGEDGDEKIVCGRWSACYFLIAWLVSTNRK